jgi:hypothetical protein
MEIDILCEVEGCFLMLSQEGEDGSDQLIIIKTREMAKAIAESLIMFVNEEDEL